MRASQTLFSREGSGDARAAAASRRRPGARSALAALAVVVAASLAAAAESPAPPARHLIYLHGRIVQDQQSARPRHPRFGHYEMEAILAAFRNRGFAVSGEIRPKSATVDDSADRVASQVRRLLDSGVPADHVTVVGASMGAGIALAAAARLQEPGLRVAAVARGARDRAPNRPWARLPLRAAARVGRPRHGVGPREAVGGLRWGRA